MPTGAERSLSVSVETQSRVSQKRQVYTFWGLAMGPPLTRDYNTIKCRAQLPAAAFAAAEVSGFAGECAVAPGGCIPRC